jgi:hypothetical protein
MQIILYPIHTMSVQISKFNFSALEVGEVDLLDEQVGVAAALHQPHLQLLRTQDVLVYLLDLLPQHPLRLSHAQVRQAQRNARSARDAHVPAQVGEQARPILGCFEVELAHIKYELLNLLWTQDAKQKRRSLALVLVGHAVAEKRTHCLQFSNAPHRLKRLVVCSFFHY